MARTTRDQWDGHFLESSPIFQALRPVAEKLAGLHDWPDLALLATLFRQQGLAVRPVEQDTRPSAFEAGYEPRIYLKRELQTRRENWHDLFNALVWLCFPRTKTLLNQLHYHAALQRRPGSNRSALENAITLFDECGVIVISRRSEWLDMIREHQWSSLFVQQRDAFERDIQCIVFGHAMYEKALAPYIGMTAQALLIHSPGLLTGDMSLVDAAVAAHWGSGAITSTKDLSPLPLLGVPGWYAPNEDRMFYENEDYFRPKRPETP